MKVQLHRLDSFDLVWEAENKACGLDLPFQTKAFLSSCVAVPTYGAFSTASGIDVVAMCILSHYCWAGDDGLRRAVMHACSNAAIHGMS